MFRLVFVLVALFVSVVGRAAENHQTGDIKNLTATEKGIMINFGTGSPDNCDGTPHGWLLIKQENTALTSVVLAVWVSGNKSGTVYTSGLENGSGFCIVNQFDPAN